MWKTAQHTGWSPESPQPCASFRRCNPAWRACADNWECGAKMSESTVASAPRLRPRLRSTSCRVTRTDTWLLSRALQRREEASGSQSPRLRPASSVFRWKLKTEIQKVFKMLLLQRRDGLSRIVLQVRSLSQTRSPSPARHRTAHVWGLFFSLFILFSFMMFADVSKTWITKTEGQKALQLRDGELSL